MQFVKAAVRSKILTLARTDPNAIPIIVTFGSTVKVNLPDGTKEESTRWITKHGLTLKEVGFIEGSEGKLHFYSEFSNVKVFKQDERLFEVPDNYKLAPVEDLDDINELLKTMVKRS